MEKREISILKNEVEVPPVVQKKADAAFAEIQKERTEAMKKKDSEQRMKKEQGKLRRLAKPLIAAAACAALIAGAGSGWGSGIGSLLGKMPFGDNFSGGEFAGRTADENGVGKNENGGNTVQNGSTAADDGTGKTAETQAAQTSRNWFTLTACAKELEPGKPVPLTDMGASGRTWALGGSEDEGTVNYCIATDFLCRGENIKQVSYSISRGAFQIEQPVDPAEQIVVDGQLFDGELNTGSIGGVYYDDTGLPAVPCETALYRSFTLDYDRQASDMVWINICDEIPDGEEILELIWGNGADATSLEERCEGINRMLDGVVITCTVHYEDGSSQSVEIEVSSRVMTYQEAGEDGGGEIPPDTREVFITFEVR